jgi:ribosomal small subunit protein bTHX
MGKGDKKTKRGKIIMGSYGVRRSQRVKKSESSNVSSVKPEVKATKAEKEEKVAKKKPIAKKSPVEKTEEAPKVTAKKKTTHKSEEKETES